MKYTIKLRNGDVDTLDSDKLDVITSEGCFVFGATDGVVLAIYPVKEVVKINKVVE